MVSPYFLKTVSYWVYILESESNHRYYIGSTSNIEKRLKHHNDGRVKSTKSDRLWILRHAEKYLTLSEACKREMQLKSWKSRKAIKKLFEAHSSNG
ncbi:MAG: GIY-YIG nuclease family protein [Patescibacteria group bacterium]